MSPRGIRILALLAIVSAMAYSVTSYTQPNHGGPAYSHLHDLLSHALGDRRPSKPGPRSDLVVISVDSGYLRVNPARPYDLAAEPTVLATLAAAVAEDSAAVRAWLGKLVLATSTADGDTVRTRLWRPTLHAGCPLVSRLEAVAVGRTSREWTYIALSSDCLPLAVPGRASPDP